MLRAKDCTHRVEQQVAAFLRLHHIAPQASVVVGLSGGADSVALLAALVAVGQPCVAAHCNFQLRGEESVRDFHFAQGVAEELSVPFHHVVFDTLNYAKEQKLSIEMACRELRYHWFEGLCQQLDAPYLAVAHHRDDSVETVLLNLMRGTGVAGLSGIKPINGYIIRPLLNLSREEIEAYLADKSLHYITDSSNREDIYTRNKVRLHLLPLMQQINPAVYEAIERSAQHMSEVEKIYRHALAQGVSEVVSERKGCNYIDIARLRLQPSPSTLLYEYLKGYGFLSQQIPYIMEALDALSGKEFLSPTHILLKDRGVLVLQPLPSPTAASDCYLVEPGATRLVHPIGLELEVIEAGAMSDIPRERHIASFDLDKLTFPLLLRHWRQGDRIHPIGMRGSKKLSDYFSNQKYSRFEKEQAWLLCSGEEIIWIVGERSSEQFKVSEKSQMILQIKYLG